jgi:hypothetical protein
LIDTGVLRRLLAFTELKFSNSMIDSSAASSVADSVRTARRRALVLGRSSR